MKGPHGNKCRIHRRGRQPRVARLQQRFAHVRQTRRSARSIRFCDIARGHVVQDAHLCHLKRRKLRGVTVEEFAAAPRALHVDTVYRELTRSLAKGYSGCIEQKKHTSTTQVALA